MDTKSTKPNRIYAFLSLLLIPLIFFAGAKLALSAQPEMLFQFYVLGQEPKYVEDSYYPEYSTNWSVRFFYGLEEAALGLKRDDYYSYFQAIAENTVYYAKNKTTGEILTNLPTDSYSGTLTLAKFEQIYNHSPKLRYYTVFDGSRFVVSDPEHQELLMDSPRFLSSDSSEKTLLTVDIDYKAIPAELENTYEIAFAFDAEFALGGYHYEEKTYSVNEMNAFLERIIIGTLCLLVAALLLIIRFVNRNGRIALAETVAKGLRCIPLELKLILYFIAVGFGFGIPHYADLLFELIAWFALCGSLYFLSVDIGINKADFGKRSICYWLYRKFRKKDKKKGGTAVSRTYRRIRRSVKEARRREQKKLLTLPYQKRLHRVLIWYLLGMLAILLAAVFGWRILYILELPFVGAGIFCLSYWFYRRYTNLLMDMERIARHVRYLRGGNFDQKLFLAPNSPLYALSVDLNNLQDGLKNEIEKRMVSEKMKVELITNVSHDLKTPLTSMINYIDLLKEEELQPDYVNDYVKVLDGKSKRLKLLIENIFDISKATSGNMPVHYGRLNMTELVNQTLAECEDYIALSELDIKKNFADEKFYVWADGKMLWRAVENVINNAAKYSLHGTRVYLELTVGNEYVCLTVKNIAGYEMKFSAEDIAERFVRGDAARTTEGTGLGLSIVKSFVEAMDGKVNIAIDGDLFKISLCIRRYRPELDVDHPEKTE